MVRINGLQLFKMQVMSQVDELRSELRLLEKLHEDLEKQLIAFDEIIPFERQRTAHIFSPRMLNMLLSCCPQIESLVEMICKICNIALKKNQNGKLIDKSIRELIGEINYDGVLAKITITGKKHGLQFTPFTQELKWWITYNELKHNLGKKQDLVNYTILMDAFAALAAFYHLTKQVLSVPEEWLEDCLKTYYWRDSPFSTSAKIDSFGRVMVEESYPYSSQNFVIREYFIH